MLQRTIREKAGARKAEGIVCQRQVDLYFMTISPHELYPTLTELRAYLHCENRLAKR